MKASKFFWIALFIGLQACVLQIIDQALSPVVYPAGAGFGWIAFQAWAMYFLSGCDMKGAIRTTFGYIIGIVASIAIMMMGGALSGALGFFAVPITLLVLVPVVIYFELMPWVINYVPSIFVGAGVYFGFMSYVPQATFSSAAITEMIYCIIGLAFGYVTVSFRGWYEAKYVKVPEKV